MSNFDIGRLAGRPRLKWTLIIGAWTLFGLLIAGESYITARARGQPMTLAQSLAWYLAWAYAWLLFTPVILWLGQRWPFNRERWRSSLAVHITASLVMSWAGAIVFMSVGQMLGQIEPGAAIMLRRSLMMFVTFLHFDPYLYWIVIGLSYLFKQYQEGRERELRESQLQTQLAEARLQALESQLHPHFLFNALNTIAVLVRTQKSQQAIRVVTGLAELLRRALDGAGRQVVPLKQEIEFIERYLEIEQIRFADRLQVEMCIEPDVLDARVPYLILQPLVENAIQHGIAPRASAGRLKIGARREGDRLRLSVEDDGIGLPQTLESMSGNGVGLSMTRERLEQLYGDDHAFAVGNADDGGVAAELDLPFQLSTDELRREV